MNGKICFPVALGHKIHLKKIRTDTAANQLFMHVAGKG
jgi:hypothetical protein